MSQLADSLLEPGVTARDMLQADMPRVHACLTSARLANATSVQAAAALQAPGALGDVAQLAAAAAAALPALGALAAWTAVH